jgi:hypothetical protein
MRANSLLVFFTLVLALTSRFVPAQTGGNAASGAKVPAETKQPSFPRLFRSATNNNGYEEWVQAADLIQNNADVDAAGQPGATLTFKRHVLADRSVARALLLVRAGMDKPVRSPREDFDENTAQPELLGLQQLARLLRTEQYVDLADGRVDAAIDALRVGLAFGYRIQTDSLLSGVIGLAVDNIVLSEFARHLDQFSVHQCGEVVRIVKEFLSAENPAVRLMALEKGYALKSLEIRRSDPESLLDFARLLVTVSTPSGAGEDPEMTANLQNLQDQLAARPQDLTAILDDAQVRINTLYDHMLLNMRLPLAQRKPLSIARANSPGTFLFRLTTADPQRILDRYTSDQAKLRLLAVHALIRRYRWEYNALPTALTELQAPDLVKDPFTDDQIVYQRDGDSYTLYSKGPVKRDDNGNEVSSERVPVKLAP